MMTFEFWLKFFRSWADKYVTEIGLTPAQLAEWKAFVDEYKSNNGHWYFLYYVKDEELIAAYYAKNPDKRSVGRLSVAELKQLLLSR